MRQQLITVTARNRVIIGHKSGWLLPVLLALLNACGTLPPVPPDTSGLPRQAQISDLTHFPQQQYHCGPASLASLLAYRGVSATPEQLAPRVYLPGKLGSLRVELVAQARQHGMLAYPLRPVLKDVLAEIGAGNPVLVMQNLGFGWWPQWHYAVARGYDLEKDTLVLSSADRSHYRVPLALFLLTWRRADSWALVVLPPDALPASAGEHRYLNAVNDLEQVGQPRAAQSGYLTAHRRWPDNAGALLGLGNTSLALGDRDGARAHFLQLTRRHPHLPAGWNNLAYALRRSGCPREARAAAECAVAVAVDKDPYRQTLAEMRADVAEAAAGSGACEPIECQQNR